MSFYRKHKISGLKIKHLHKKNTAQWRKMLKIETN